MSRKIGDTGLKAEKKLAARLGGRQTLASGARGDDKGDVEVGRWLIEGKATVTGNYALKHLEMSKISTEALSKGRRPAFSVLFVDERGNPLRFGSWVLIRESDFQELVASEEQD